MVGYEDIYNLRGGDAESTSVPAGTVRPYPAHPPRPRTWGEVEALASSPLVDGAGLEDIAQVDERRWTPEEAAEKLSLPLQIVREVLALVRPEPGERERLARLRDTYGESEGQLDFVPLPSVSEDDSEEMEELEVVTEKSGR